MTDQVSLNACSPARHGKLGVMFCPHGCVTQCERERRRDERSDQAQDRSSRLVGADGEHTPRGRSV